MSNHDIEGHVPPEASPDATDAPTGAPDSLERQLAKEREARQLIRDRLRHTEALAAESHALRSQMGEELERVTAERDRLRAEAAIATAVATPGPAVSEATVPDFGAAAPGAGRPRVPPADLRERPGSAERGASASSARGAEPTMSPMPPSAKARDEHLIGERPLKPPTRRGPWRAIAMLGAVAVAVAGLAWVTGTMPSGMDFSALKPSTADVPTARTAPALAMDARPDTPAASVALAATTPSAALASTAPSNGPVPLPPLSPETQLAAAPPAAGPVATAASAPASVPPPIAVAATEPPSLHAQSQLQAQGGLDVRLRRALDGEGITSIVEIDPVSGHVRVADPQADRPLRERTDMLIRAVYAGASLPEPQIEHRWMSPMHGDRAGEQQAQAAPQAKAPPHASTKSHGQTQAAAATAPHDLATARTPGMAAADRVALAPPSAGGPTRHVELARPIVATADGLELQPVVPSGRLTASCMTDIAGKASNRRGALSACMKRSCCSNSGNLNSEECRAYQKAYPYTCSAG